MLGHLVLDHHPARLYPQAAAQRGISGLNPAHYHGPPEGRLHLAPLFVQWLRQLFHCRFHQSP